jgi:uncharacterized repeat protein (TIGR03803 family)
MKIFVTTLAQLCLICAAIAGPSIASQFELVVLFDSVNGSSPSGKLVQGFDGSLWGTTCNGGTKNVGTVYQVTYQGVLTTMHSFDTTDGACPYGGLILGINGDFYGTTPGGGTNSAGTVFEITPHGTLTTLNNVGSSGGDRPIGALLQTPSRLLYGTTWGAGAHTDGIIFSISPSGSNFKTVASFLYSNGAYPYDGLAEDGQGNFYGTTQKGGDGDNGAGIGTVFKLSPEGIITTLHSFNGTDGQWPTAGLVLASNGTLYGATPAGGANGQGTIFSITPAGDFQVLSNVGSSWGLIQANDGNLYGVTNISGVPGTLIRMTLSGTTTTLFTFGEDEGRPSGPLAQATDGTLWGVADGAGTGPGAVYRYNADLDGLVVPVPAFGKVGSGVALMGPEFTGATSVTFNGVAASYTVKSSTLIWATVPTGATTGPIEVSGFFPNAYSNPFIVEP